MSDPIFELCNKFLDIEEEKAKLESQIKELELKVKAYDQEMYDIGRFIQEIFIQNDVSNFKIRGRTIYIHKQSWAKPKNKDYETACKVLKEIGMGWLVYEKINTHTISSHVRECDSNDTPLPERFYEVFDVSEVFSVKSRKVS